MMADSKSPTLRMLDRLDLRLPGETFDAIDTARRARPGNISRNTWITEAIEEKLAREQIENGSHEENRSHELDQRHA